MERLHGLNRRRKIKMRKNSTRREPITRAGARQKGVCQLHPFLLTQINFIDESSPGELKSSFGGKCGASGRSRVDSFKV